MTLPARAELGDAAERELVSSLQQGWFGAPPASYFLTRSVFLRAIGFIYAVAFLVLVEQWPGLIGSHGLLPASDFVAELRGDGDLFDWPTLFWFDASDAALHGWAVAGLLLSIAVMLGLENALAMLALWVVYLSFCHVGQTFWGYGWEILLLEAGFLAIFISPVGSIRPLRSRVAPPIAVVFMLRWLLFRVMLGAGLIKIRGDACWRDLTCLAYHYETQPVPHPLSWLLHQAPLWFHQLGVAFNHVVELGAPWLLFGPRRARHAAGAAMVAFQLILIASGNLSFLNWLTLAVCLACFDDALFARLLPARVGEQARALALDPRKSRAQIVTSGVLAVVVALLSYGPITNMISSRQAMNTSFDPLHLVNSYGAFGSVGKKRHEVILEGTRDRQLGAATRWTAYEFKCKPGDVRRRPCLITPYHYRLDWQMWFAALGDVAQEPWIVRLVYKLLRGEPAISALLARDPFGQHPPHYIRAQLYEYRFTRFGDATDAWWQRRYVGPYIRPLALGDRALHEFLERRGWLEPGGQER